MHSSENDHFTSRISEFVQSLRTDTIGEFRMCPDGNVTLYASCFAVMTLHYLGVLSNLSQETRRQWAEYILQWQDPISGYFMGPELVREEITSTEHDWDVVRMHLAVHVLPALDLLGVQPKYPLSFAHVYIDIEYLLQWLNARNWARAWLEGNNLLFIGQFLVHLRDIEHIPEAQSGIDLYFEWLDRHIDPISGLWGAVTNHTSRAHALYGAYHQLLVYFFEEHAVPYPEALVESTLKVQEFDGGFALSGNGGACEDVDAINVLVNLYQRYDYQRPVIRRSLRRAYKAVLSRMTPEGGFVYEWNAPFLHMSIPRTRGPANIPHLFASWFGVHTLALIAEVLTDEPALDQEWKFNSVLSMGWHFQWDRSRYALKNSDWLAEQSLSCKWNDFKHMTHAFFRRVERGVKWKLYSFKKMASSVLK